jgi:hypothetical protein
MGFSSFFDYTGDDVLVLVTRCGCLICLRTWEKASIRGIS